MFSITTDHQPTLRKAAWGVVLVAGIGLAGLTALHPEWVSGATTDAGAPTIGDGTPSNWGSIPLFQGTDLTVEPQQWWPSSFPDKGESRPEVADVATPEGDALSSDDWTSADETEESDE